MAQTKASKLYIEGIFIPTIAGSIKAGLPVDVFKTQQVSGENGVGTVGYESLEDSQKAIKFEFPLEYEGEDVLEKIKAAMNNVRGSHVTVVDQGGRIAYDYIECFATEHNDVEFNGEQRGSLTLTGSAIV